MPWLVRGFQFHQRRERQHQLGGRGQFGPPLEPEDVPPELPPDPDPLEPEPLSEPEPATVTLEPHEKIRPRTMAAAPEEASLIALVRERVILGLLRLRHRAAHGVEARWPPKPGLCRFL